MSLKQKKIKFEPRVKLNHKFVLPSLRPLFSDARMKDLRFVWSLLICE